MFKGSNWLPNTTRGTNDYSNCSHAIYLYEQNANPILLNWLDASNAEFRSAYALTEVVQWLWRTRLRRGEPVIVYMPSKKMRELIQTWLYATKASSHQMPNNNPLVPPLLDDRTSACHARTPPRCCDLPLLCWLSHDSSSIYTIRDATGLDVRLSWL